MLDRVIGEIQQGLVDGLPWLDAAFGRCQRVTKRTTAGRLIVTPDVYCGGWNGHGENDYIEVSPDSKIGNFSFFVLEDPQEFTTDAWARHYTSPVGLVFWFDLRKVYGTLMNRNTEYLKAQILSLLGGLGGWHLTSGRVVFNRCFERAENIYRGFSLSEIDNQFLIHPYGGFRFDGVLEYDELCTE